MNDLRALSVRQPWAHLLCSGQKRYETRSWRTTRRGWVLVHASKAPAVPGLPSGAIVGAVQIIGCHPVEVLRDRLTPAERLAGNFDDGRFAWEVTTPRFLRAPIPIAGGLSFWAVDPVTLRAVRRALSL